MCLKSFQRTALSLYPRGSEHWPRSCGLTAARATLVASHDRQYVRLFWFSLAPDHGIQTSRYIFGGFSKESHGCTESSDGLPLLAFRQGQPAGKIMPPLSRSEKGVSTPSPSRKDPVSTAITTAGSATRALPPVLGRLLSGTFWLALRVPLQVIFALWTTRLVLQAIGPGFSGAYKFAWGFGFFQMLFEFGISSALHAPDLRLMDPR